MLRGVSTEPFFVFVIRVALGPLWPTVLPCRLRVIVPLLALPACAHALVLGAPVAVSPIGAPLRVEIAVARGDLSRFEECVRLAPGGGDADLPWVRDARISLIGRTPDARILVESRDPVAAPALRLGLEERCDTSLRREYTLLLPFPAAQPAAPAGDGRPPSGGTRAMAPAGGDRPLGNPRRNGGTVVRGAPAGEVPTKAAVPTPNAPPTMQAAEVERLRRQREQEVAAALVRTREAEQALHERIRRLEQTRERLMAQVRDLDLPTSRPAASPGRDVVPNAALPPSAAWPLPAIVATFAALSLLLALALLRWRRRRKREIGAADLDAGSRFDEWSGVFPEHAAPRPDAPAPPPGAATPVIPRATVEAKPAPPASPYPPPAIPLGLASDSSPVSASEVALPLADEAAEEHQSAIELAEILMGFGRVQGAAETLAEFIRSNPRRSVMPWLKLLDVYRRAGLRPEFDAIARQLNKTFNVKRVSWDTFDAARAARDSLEELPHVAKTLQEQWGTPACQGYLERLLRDNRGGSRLGFPLSVIDEILTLQAVLEEVLGPYQAENAEAAGFA